ncbi:hypothetical protein JMJ35_003906 [Cladonia borealis]|uniref:Uncharacterized protein n=1 Tax=Cladonia borealis TaxID=184061 RepID=A0AA39R264_9LECA|nr:hypothetical protein JMJ35_003906 [Cladonia borealis]
MPPSYSSICIIGPHQLVLMSIHINCPNCHILSSLTLSKPSPQDPISTPPAFREHPSPTADLSDIPIDGAMLGPLAPELRRLAKAQQAMARHGHAYHFPGHAINPNYIGSPNLLTPYGQPQQINWEASGIPTRNDGGAQYAIHRAVEYAYDKGYQDAQKHKPKYDSFKQVLDEADKKESAELKDRLGHERRDLTRTYIDGLSISQIRDFLEHARGASQRHHGGHKAKHARKHRDRSKARSHHRNRSPRRNHRNRERRFEDTDSSESSDEDDYVYRQYLGALFQLSLGGGLVGAVCP